MIWQIINTLLGTWLMAAPGVLRYEGTLAADHERIVGPIAATFACIAIWGVLRAVRWVNLPIGLWLLAAPWVLGFEPRVTLNEMTVGLLLAICSMPRGRIRPKFDGGWKVLLQQNAPPEAYQSGRP